MPGSRGTTRFSAASFGSQITPKKANFLSSKSAWCASGESSGPCVSGLPALPKMQSTM